MMKAIALHVRYNILNKINGIDIPYCPSFYDITLEEKGQTSLFEDSVEDFKEFHPDEVTEEQTSLF